MSFTISGSPYMAHTYTVNRDATVTDQSGCENAGNYAVNADKSLNHVLGQASEELVEHLDAMDDFANDSPSVSTVDAAFELVEELHRIDAEWERSPEKFFLDNLPNIYGYDPNKV